MFVFRGLDLAHFVGAVVFSLNSLLGKTIGLASFPLTAMLMFGGWNR